MRTLRRICLVLLWLLAAVGVASGAVWALTAAGAIKPLVVISGSMEPEIMTGDLVVDTKTDASTLEPGDVVSLPNAQTGNLVTHRIQTIVADGDGSFTVTMKGDANQFEDALDYSVTGQVWMPQARIPGAGAILTRISSPGVVVPMMLGLVGLLGVVWLLPAEAAPSRRKSRARSASAEPADAGAS